MEVAIKKEQSNDSSGEVQIRIDNHKKAAQHHQKAANVYLDSDDELRERRIQSHHQKASKHHLDAAKFHESGEHTKASDSTIKAHFFASLARELSEDKVLSND